MEEVNEERLEEAGAAEVAQGPEGLLFTGNAIRALSVAQLASLGEFASRMFGVEMRPLHDIERDLGKVVLAPDTSEPEPEPVLIDSDRTDEWFALQGYSKIRRTKMFDAIGSTGYSEESDPQSDLRYIGELSSSRRPRDLDLRSVYERLRRTSMSSKAWRAFGGKNPSTSTMKIMVEYINWAVEPDEPLDFANAQETPYPWIPRSDRR